MSAIQVDATRRRAFFTTETLAVYLSLSDRTIRDMLKEGEIASYKVRGARRIDPADVDSYLAEHRHGKAAA
jgi:excisionase family DNA binding protein